LRLTRRPKQQRQVKCVAKYLAEGAYFVFVSTEGRINYLFRTLNTKFKKLKNPSLTFRSGLDAFYLAYSIPIFL